MTLRTNVGACAVLALALLSAAAVAQTPPNIPTRLPNSEVERFNVTLNGSQGSTFTFSVDIPNPSCPIHSEGRLTEDWKFERGKDVVVEFRRIKGTRTVFLQRRGHPPGDVSFATPGTVFRTATGFWNEMGPGCRGLHNFSVEDCDRKIRAKADARFIWAEGKLTMEPTSKSMERLNPARACGGGADNINGLSYEHPLLAKQKGKLTAAQVFGTKKQPKRKHIVVALSAHPPMLPREGTYMRETETIGGSSRLVLSRLP